VSGTVERLDGQPIILVTITGHVDGEIARSIYKQSAEIADAADEMLYRILDVRQMTTSFPEMLEVVRESGKGLPGSGRDPRIKNIYVGNNNMAKLARDLMKQFGVEMLMFLSMEDAHTYIQNQIEESSQLSG